MGHKVHVGCGEEPMLGFVNIDVREVPTPAGMDVRQGSATSLGLPDQSCELVFSNALFEHLFLGHLIPTLREWKRVLEPDGLIATIGIPDFTQVAHHYLNKSKGITGETFDLFEAYRFALGWAEQYDLDEPWQDLEPERLPANWLPQTHKAIYDSDFLHDLCKRAGLEATVFTYAYRDEPPLNLAFLAAHEQPSIDRLNEVPHINRWVRQDSVHPSTSTEPSRMGHFAEWATLGHFPDD